MHDSATRLLDFARSATAESERPITSFQNLLVQMDVTSATMTNWKKRGVSKEGAIEAERMFGCNAHWLLTGESPEAKQPGADFKVMEAPSVYLGRPVAASLQSALDALVGMLKREDQLTREMIAPIIARMVLDPEEAPSLAAMVHAAVNARHKRAS